MKYEVITDVSQDGVIIQRLIQDKVQEVSRWVCDTRELALIKALIKLGWTPPNKPLKQSGG